MLKEEYLSLMQLDKKDFTYREWVALAYAREWTFGGGVDPCGELSGEFRKQYSEKERAMIRKLMRMMLFANYCGNAYFKRPWNRGGAETTCVLPVDGSQKDIKNEV